STKIRNLLAEGKIKEASNLLGRPFSFEGKVVDGDKRGRLLGYPTANIETEEKYLLPRQGIYAVRVNLRDKVFYGMANLGVVCKFIKDKEENKVEVYIFDFIQDVDSEIIKIDWLEFIRDEEEYSGAVEMNAQLVDDEIVVRKVFNI